MTDQEPQRKKGGRPRKHSPDAKRPTMAFRMGEKLHQQLIEAAAANERSLSEEIERRLEHTFALDHSLSVRSRNTSVLLQRISIACAMIETWQSADGSLTGSTDWKNHEPTAAAIKRVLRDLADDIAPTPTSTSGVIQTSEGLRLQGEEVEDIWKMEAVADRVVNFVTGRIDIPKPPLGFSS